MLVPEEPGHYATPVVAHDVGGPDVGGVEEGEDVSDALLQPVRGAAGGAGRRGVAALSRHQRAQPRLVQHRHDIVEARLVLREAVQQDHGLPARWSVVAYLEAEPSAPELVHPTHL